MQDALGYVDLEGICRSLSFAIMRHVDFAAGFLLLDDLREAENIDANFSYKLTENLKIDLEEIRRKREADRVEAEKKKEENYQNLKKMMNAQPVEEERKFSNVQTGTSPAQCVTEEGGAAIVEEEEHLKGSALGKSPEE